MRTVTNIARLPITAWRFAFGRAKTAPAAAEPRPRPRGLLRRLALAFGTFALVSGGVILSFGVFHWYADDAEAPGGAGFVLAYRDDPGAVYDRPLVTPVATPIPEVTPPPGIILGVPPAPRESNYRMVIDKIGVNAGVYTYGLDDAAVPEVPLNGYDIAWYNFSAPPGTGSNAVFAGHVTWNGRAVFWYLDTLVPGDQVRLIANDGSELIYTVAEAFLIDPDAPDAVSVMFGTPEDLITIITCGGDPYYIGGPFNYDYTHRQVIRATLSHANVPAPAQPAVAEPAASGG